MIQVLQCVKPGAKTGQIILSVDLTVAGNADRVLVILSELGYYPEIRHVNYSEGIHVLAVLKDEQHETVVDENHLIDEWMQLCDRLNPNAVRLWRGL